MHPDEFTLRQLVDMADANVRVRWSQVSFLAAYTHNSGINAKRVVTPDEVNPYKRSKRRRIKGKASFRELKSMLF